MNSSAALAATAADVATDSDVHFVPPPAASASQSPFQFHALPVSPSSANARPSRKRGRASVESSPLGGRVFDGEKVPARRSLFFGLILHEDARVRFSLELDEDVPLVNPFDGSLPTRLYRSDAAVRRGFVVPPGHVLRVIEYRTLRPLRVATLEGGGALGALQSEEERASVLDSGAGFDGWKVDEDSIAVRNVEEKLRLVDDDKQAGMSQAFITDMFSKMKIGS